MIGNAPNDGLWWHYDEAKPSLSKLSIYALYSTSKSVQRLTEAFPLSQDKNLFRAHHIDHIPTESTPAPTADMKRAFVVSILHLPLFTAGMEK